MSVPNYNHLTIEEKWQKIWEDQDLFQNTPENVGTPDPAKKSLLLFAFAYPSGSGLHVGHVESKTALDILARMQRMQGKQVYFPVGWDAFGLPAENYAVKTGIHPAITTKNAIDTFRRQIRRLGISYDWANEIATNHPQYYRWTQWLFLQLYKKGLAYQGLGMVNWCPSCMTVLANEQVVNGLCERCDAEVVQKKLKQWYFKITQYQDELITGLEEVDWPVPTKQQQLNWIGRKQGINITYQVEGSSEQITCFTTRPDTNFGATFIVLAPEHNFVHMVASGKLAKSLNDQKIASEVKKYIDDSMKKTELERQQEGRKKTGVFTGFYATNNLNGRRLPVYVSDFVLAGFGTGAVVGVPGHDKRDFEFAQAFGLEVIRVVQGPDGQRSQIVDIDQVQEDEGLMMNSQFLDGLEIHQATEKIMDYLEEHGWGKRVTTYKLRDWLISRQRYWGAPIPIVYDPEGNPHPVKDEHLPWLLPTDVDFKPTGESPLKSSREFIERTEKLYGEGWRPEFDTMDTFVDSSWYYLRYCDARNSEVFASQKRMSDWLPVDLYLIGPEHIVLHLLYSRFFTKFLRDEGHLNFDEPFSKMRHQGMILGPDNKKMSKSKGNVINPDEIIEKYGADTLRVYEMFMGPLEADKPWSTTAVAGVNRFLKKVFRLVVDELALLSQSRLLADDNHQNGEPTSPKQHIETNDELRRKLHQTIKKVTEDVPALKYNTSIAAMMEFANLWQSLAESRRKSKQLVSAVISLADLRSFLMILAPFAPFLAEDLWSSSFIEPGQAEEARASIHLEKWPEYLESLTVDDQIKIAVQVNGKIRGEILIDSKLVADQEYVLEKAKSAESVARWLLGQAIKKELYVKGKIVSIVV
ncbi:MAG: leucine--tRNA ligase [Patescibacteria group bacterium]